MKCVTGHPIKREYGPSMLGKFKSLAKLKYLRGTPADIFGYTTERRAERELIKEYQALVKSIGADLSPANHALASRLWTR